VNVGKAMIEYVSEWIERRKESGVGGESRGKKESTLLVEVKEEHLTMGLTREQIDSIESEEKVWSELAAAGKANPRPPFSSTSTPGMKGNTVGANETSTSTMDTAVR